MEPPTLLDIDDQLQLFADYLAQPEEEQQQEPTQPNPTKKELKMSDFVPGAMDETKDQEMAETKDQQMAETKDL